MKKLFWSTCLFGISSIACPQDVPKPITPKYAVHDCVANSPEDEFEQPDTLKILAVGKKRYQYHRWNNSAHGWNDTKEDSLITFIDNYYHLVKCAY